MTDATNPDTDNTTPDVEQPTPPTYTPEELAAHYASLHDRPMPPPLDDDIARMAVQQEQRDELLQYATHVATSFREFTETFVPFGQTLLPAMQMMMTGFNDLYSRMVQAGLIDADGEPTTDAEPCPCEEHTAPTPEAPPKDVPRPGRRDDLDKTQMVVIDGREALVAVIVRPADDDKPGSVTVEAMANGMDKEDSSAILRRVADMWEKEYAAEKAAVGAAAEEQLNMLKDLFGAAATEPPADVPEAATDAAPDA